MKKKILSFMLAVVLGVGIVVPALPSVTASAIRFNPDDPSGVVKKYTILYSKPSELSIPLGIVFKDTAVNIEKSFTDSNGVEWIKVKEYDRTNGFSGYIKRSEFSPIYY